MPQQSVSEDSAHVGAIGLALEPLARLQWLQRLPSPQTIRPEAGPAEAQTQWLQRHPEAGSSWPIWPRSSYLQHCRKAVPGVANSQP